MFPVQFWLGDLDGFIFGLYDKANCFSSRGDALHRFKSCTIHYVEKSLLLLSRLFFYAERNLIMIINSFPHTKSEKDEWYTVGTYTGDDANSQTINLGRTPNAVLVVANGAISTSTKDSNSGSILSVLNAFAITGFPAHTRVDVAANALISCQIVDNGFTVFNRNGNSEQPQTNRNNILYYYIAFF